MITKSKNLELINRIDKGGDITFADTHNDKETIKVQEYDIEEYYFIQSDIAKVSRQYTSIFLDTHLFYIKNKEELQEINNKTTVTVVRKSNKEELRVKLKELIRVR